MEVASGPCVEAGVVVAADGVVGNNSNEAVGTPTREDHERASRIQSALARGEAPIRPEFLANFSSPSLTLKRCAPESDKKDEAAATPDKPDRQSNKRRKGQNKAKDRVGNASAMKMVRAGQICSKLAYLNSCKDVERDDARRCKAAHDPDAFFAGKPESIGRPCPVLESLGVCPAGLNCRFDGHIVDGKNVDRDGVVLSPESAWATTIPGVGHPTGEANIIGFELVGQLRKKVYDFSRSVESARAWSKYCSGACDTPLGALVQAERKTIDLRGKRVLAPLTTVGNLPFRRLCMKLGCEVTVGEMALATSVLEGSQAELSLLRRHSSETCFGIQVAGGDVETMAKFAQFVDENIDCDFVDINCGCPLDEVHRRGAGSRLMARHKCLEGVVRCMSHTLKTKPLTVKMRTADHEDKKSSEFSGRYAHKLIPQVEQWGASALTLHGRTARQRYSKLADWDYVAECSKRRVLDTPFIACGDVLSWEDAEEHRSNHGVDSIMIGRGALMKPWLFSEIRDRQHWDISASERFDLIRDFTNYGLEHWGADARGVETTRRFLLEWLSFTSRYVPIGLLEQMPPKINWRPRPYIGRSDLETKLSSTSAKDWIEISEMLLGKVPEGFSFVPKHKSSSYENPATADGARQSN